MTIKELTDAVTDTKADPYADKTNNNEAENINTSTLKKGDKSCLPSLVRYY